MLNDAEVLEEVPGLYKIVSLNLFRKTPGVIFDNVPTKAFSEISAIDRVLHESGAISPGPVGEVKRPWYMHPHQDDNLVVLSGTRVVDIYTRAHGRVEEFCGDPSRFRKTVRSFLREQPCLSGRAGCFIAFMTERKALPRSISPFTTRGSIYGQTSISMISIRRQGSSGLSGRDMQARHRPSP